MSTRSTTPGGAAPRAVTTYLAVTAKSMAWSRTVDTSGADTLGEYRYLKRGLFTTANSAKERWRPNVVLQQFSNVERVTGIEPALSSAWEVVEIGRASCR